MPGLRRKCFGVRSIFLGVIVVFIFGSIVTIHELHVLSTSDTLAKLKDPNIVHSGLHNVSILLQKMKSINQEGMVETNMQVRQGNVSTSHFPDSLPNILTGLPHPNYDVHVFYYPWYCNPNIDGKYMHWNHPYLSHWDKKENDKWPKGHHEPPDDIGSNFYPELGPYSSRDPKVLHNHMQQIRMSGAGVLAVSWYPVGMADENGISWDEWLPDLFAVAHIYQLKVCFHIEPFKGRNAETVQEALGYIASRYGDDPAYYYVSIKEKNLPLIYIYDSYMVPTEQWKMLLTPDGSLTIRNTKLDAVVIGLVVEQRHQKELQSANFDGFYTYFASDGFSYGSTTRNWLQMTSFGNRNDMLFIPSVGPGYIDDQIRPWNSQNTKKREGGAYFERIFQSAIAAKTRFISITSFNEWGEGTQIERAVPFQWERFKYEDYLPNKSDYYLSLSRKWVHKFSQQKRISR